MNYKTHADLVGFIWNICNLLRGPYKRSDYRKVILPFTVLRRFECLLEPTRDPVLDEHKKLKGKADRLVDLSLEKIAGHQFYNLSKMQFTLSHEGAHSVLDDPNNLAANLNSHINGYSANVRTIMDKFKIAEQIQFLADKNLLYNVVREFASIDLSPKRVDQMQMGYIFEELIRIGAEESNDEAGNHFTPREVIKLMVNLLLAPEASLSRSHVVKTIYDPTCGTGGMLSVAEEYIRELNAHARPKMFGQDFNDDAWAVCKSDMLIKGEETENIILGNTITHDGFNLNGDHSKWRFDYMLANPPFGVDWRNEQQLVEHEANTMGYDGRFGAGTPRVNDGAILFLQHMIAKMQPVSDGGSRIGIVFNGSPLFTGDAGSGESNIRRWIIENDWLEAVVALPEQLFYNTGIATYIWIITNRKEKSRQGKIQLIDARNFWVQMEKSLGKKRRRIGDPSDKPKDPNHIADITKIYANFKDGETRQFTVEGKEKKLEVSKIFDNADFGYHKITVERPLRENYQVNEMRIACLHAHNDFKKMAQSNKKNETARQQDINEGKARQEIILALLSAFQATHLDTLFKDRLLFLEALGKCEKESDIKLTAAEKKMLCSALAEKDETAEIVCDKHGNAIADADLRDTETVPLKEDINAYFAREVLPHVPDAWIDHAKTKIGYEIPLNRHFYRYEPPRELSEIESDIRGLESEIMALLNVVTK